MNSGSSLTGKPRKIKKQSASHWQWWIERSSEEDLFSFRKEDKCLAAGRYADWEEELKRKESCGSLERKPMHLTAVITLSCAEVPASRWHLSGMLFHALSSSQPDLSLLTYSALIPRPRLTYLFLCLVIPFAQTLTRSLYLPKYICCMET